MPLPLIAAALAPVLIKELPSIASWIFGDSTGKAVEAVTGAARQVFGTDDPVQLEAAIAAAIPAQALEFKRIVLEAEGQERERRHQEMLAALADVQSARQQTVDLAKAGSAIAWGAPLVSALAVLVFAGFVYLLFVRVLPPEMKDALMLLAGTAAGGFTTTLAYWLGSSAGSASKDATLSAIAKK